MFISVKSAWVSVCYLYGNIQHEAGLSGVCHTHDSDAVGVSHTHFLQDTIRREETQSLRSETHQTLSHPQNSCKRLRIEQEDLYQTIPRLIVRR